MMELAEVSLFRRLQFLSKHDFIWLCNDNFSPCIFVVVTKRAIIWSVVKVQLYTFQIGCVILTDDLYFLKKKFVGPLMLFWNSDVCPGFQSQARSLACFIACVILRFTSGVTPTDGIDVSVIAESFWSTYLQTCPKALVEVWELNPRPSVQRAQRCIPFGPPVRSDGLYFLNITDRASVKLHSQNLWDNIYIK